MKKCPFCVAMIDDDALKCMHCGEWVEKITTPDHPTPGPDPVPEPSRAIPSGPSLGRRLKSLSIALLCMFIAAMIAGFFTQLGLRMPAIGLAMLVFASIGLVAVSGMWLDPAPSAKIPPPHAAAIAIPLAAFIPALIAVVLVGPGACLWEDWSRMPLWARIVAFLWLTLAVGFGAVGAAIRPGGRKLVFRAKACDAAFIGTLFGLLGGYVLAVIVTLIFVGIDSDSEEYRARIFSLDQPILVWVMLGLGALGGLSIRLGFQASDRKAKVPSV